MNTPAAASCAVLKQWKRTCPAAVPRKDSEAEGRRTRASGESVGLLLVVGGALVLGNLAMQGVSRLRVDATKEERFSLSKLHAFKRGERGAHACSKRRPHGLGIHLNNRKQSRYGCQK